ncbi:MAG: 3-phosphoshikimate 1-carboxyvinyltransferase [Lachnospiraceae bacterium]|nr:3-phosphoshikimate 1-carboxyvinyltransferase [Lachnospiraceae bacterium]
MSEQYRVRKLDNPIDWKVRVPGSKSMTNRVLLLAALQQGRITVDGVLFSDDSRVFLGSLQSLGFDLQIDEEKKQVVLEGCGGKIPKQEAEIYVGSAGTAARFLTAMLGCSEGTYVINASEQMKKRPMRPLFELLEQLGAQIVYLEQEYYLPVRITGCMKVGGRMISDSVVTEVGCSKNTLLPKYMELDISKSTQFLSAMLLIAPMFKQGLQIHITSEKKDGSYIRITRHMMEAFGVTASFDGENYLVPPNAKYYKEQYTVEPDMSAACYFYAAAAMTGGKALVYNVYRDNTQGDLKFLEVLKQLGCNIKEEPEGIAVIGPRNGKLQGIHINMNDFSDQTMTLAVLAPFCKEKVWIEGIGHIRLQESDRLYGIATELAKLGVRCEEEESAITIYPGMPRAGVVETYEDHRMAMAFSLIGLMVDGIVIDNPMCCRKTFENYFELLEDLCQN